MATKRRIFEARQKAFKKVPHNFNKKICRWVYCSGCGLVALNNEATRKRMAKPCESMED